MSEKEIQGSGVGLPGAEKDVSDFAAPKVGDQKKKNKKETPKGKYKRSGHLSDQMLKYESTRKHSTQISLFDSLKPETIKDIEVSGIEITQIVEGIKLSPAETKIIDSLCKLLHVNSQHLNPKEKTYYSGNAELEIINYGGERTTAPKLAFTLYELTKEYKGGQSISGKDVENVANTLQALSKKQFLLKYRETAYKKGGGRIEKEIETYEKIIKLPVFKQREYSKENIEVSKKEETLIILHPIFRRQIDSKFILYPDDIISRTQISYGSHNISEVTIRLRDYLMRELTYKHFESEIYLHNLYDLVAEKWMREKRKKKVKESLDKAIDTVKIMGILEDYKIVDGSSGEPKVIFYLNKEWQ
jgi:hypothetical protein